MNEADKALLKAAQAIEAEHSESLRKIAEIYRGLHLPKIDTSSFDAMRALFDNPELKAARETLEAALSKTAAQWQEISEAMKGFEAKHSAAIAAISEEAGTMLQTFLDDLSIDDLKESIGLELTEEQAAAFEADKRAFFLDLPLQDCITLYEYKSNRYRTRARAEKAAEIVSKLPKSLAVTTAREYQFATSLFQQGNAYLQQFKGIENLKFNGGRLYFPDMKPVSEVELQNMRTKEGITEIDLPLLRVFYNVILSEFQKTGILKDIVAVYVPELAEFMGLKRNLTRQEVETKIIAKVQSFHNVTGLLKGTRNGKESLSYYQVLNFEWYNEKTNTIAFSSPYMNLVIQTIFNVAVRRDKAGKPKLKSNGEPLRLPSHSYLIDSEIVKERNKAAVENVVIIVTLIEQAGDNVPRIKASTIIERNPQLQERLESSENKGQFLKRVFSKTWELLRTHTKLTEVYEDIQLPFPDNPAYIPTAKTLSSMVFTFPHKGKKQS